ncbi:MAG: hypothetical protein EHM65_06830 [Acidobacteriales bacterium]|nr:MAG: hypothetical protein EHM65_06830 [Terriglobales bacterium]
MDIPAAQEGGNEKDAVMENKGGKWTLSWKTGMGLFNRQRALELQLRELFGITNLLLSTLLVDPHPETYFRRLSEIRPAFDALRKRLEL